MTRRSMLAAMLAPAAGWSKGPEFARYETPFKYGRLVLSASPDKDAFDSRSVDCPFVFTHEGKFYMTYVGYDGMGYQTGLASSRNLVDWRRIGCILKRDPASPVTRYNVAMNWVVRENPLRSAGRLRKIRGRFLGAYHAYPNPGYESGAAVIGLCWSDNLLHWDLDEPFLRPADGAAWERGGLYKPCLVERRDKFYLFYNAKTADPRGWREQTGVAVSSDLTTWSRYEGNPIIANGGPGSSDERFASDPCVLMDGDTWVIFYYGLDARGRARDLLALGQPLFT